MHAVIRRYRVRLGTVAQAVRYAEKQFVPLVRRIPGFVGCYLMDAGAVLAAATAEGTVPAERRGLADRRHAAALVPAGPWNGAERRAGSDRRAGGGPERRAEFAGQAGWQTAGWRAAG